MRTQTIIYINKLLKNQKENAHNDYIALKKKFQEKYDTEWIEDVLTGYEKEAYYALKDEYLDASDTFEDFKNHQWN